MSNDRTPEQDNALIKPFTSIRLPPLVKPQDPFMLAISVCSIQRSGETPDKRYSMRQSLKFIEDARAFLAETSMMIYHNCYGLSQQNKVACMRVNKCICPSSMNVLLLS